VTTSVVVLVEPGASVVEEPGEVGAAVSEELGGLDDVVGEELVVELFGGFSPHSNWNLEYVAQGWHSESMQSPAPQPVSPPTAA